MTITLSMGSNTVKSYAEILEFFGRVGYDEEAKFVMIPNYNANPNGCRNFWRMYKKKANATVQAEWDEMFGTGKPWKKPNTDEWRFYFNLPDLALLELAKAEPKLEPEVLKNVEELENEIHDLELARKIQAPEEIIDQIKEEIIEKSGQEGFAFTEEQLQAIRNL